MNVATKTLARISAIVACAAFGGAIASYESPSAQWRFDVSLDGKPIGVHTFELQMEGTRKILMTEASFDVKFLFVTAFRYRHENTEVWDKGCLRSLEAATNSNGKELRVRGSVENDGFSVQSTEGRQALPACVQTFAYWNPAILDSPQLLNSQTGVYEDVSVTLEGPDQVLVDGEPVEATRYRLSAQAGDITLWYATADNTWIGLEAPAKGGRKIMYQAVIVPEAGMLS